MKKILMTLCFSLLLSLPAYAADTPDALLAKAGQGDMAAARALGRAYAAGAGVAQDDTEALFWMIASSSSADAVGEELDIVARRLGPERAHDAMERALAWRKKQRAAHPEAFPEDSNPAVRIFENTFIFLVFVVGPLLYAWEVYRVRRWFKRHKGVVREKLAGTLGHDFALLRFLQYGCCVLPAFVIFHCRWWTLCIAIVYFTGTWWLQRKLEPQLAGSKGSS